MKNLKTYKTIKHVGEKTMTNIMIAGTLTFCIFAIVISYIAYKDMKIKHEQFMETYKKQAEHYEARIEEFKQRIEEFENKRGY